MQLDVAFDTRPNAFNALRLLLASSVIVWHAVMFTSDIDPANPGWQALEQLAVDGFFVLSGFLIVRSWMRRPDARAFLRARLVRLLPGLWLCLVVTALVIAPLGAGHPVAWAEQARYVIGNAAVLVTEPGMLSTDHGGHWNLSLWSLWWELLCYTGVVVLGVSGLLRSRVLAGLAVFCWAWMAVITATGFWLHIPGVLWISAIPRLGLMFLIGALFYVHAERVRLRGSVAAVAALVLSVSVVTPNYHLLGAPALGYLLLWLGMELGRARWLRFGNDMSYGVYLYGSPVMVALLMTGTTSVWWQLVPLTGVVVAPMAAASWFLVEKPILAWNRSSRAASGPAVPAIPAGRPPKPATARAG